MRSGSWVLAGLLLGCGTSTVRTRTAPAPALAEAAARLKERGIQLDAEGTRPDRLRTTWFCHLPDQAWEVTLQRPGNAPVPFTVEGPGRAGRRSRALPAAGPGRGHRPGGRARHHAGRRAGWWRLEDRGCQPVGEPLLGRVRCEYGYRGAAVSEDPRAFFFGILAGI
ncbi:MAG: hypothetical protein R3F60_16740 [bacterium]